MASGPDVRVFVRARSALKAKVKAIGPVVRSLFAQIAASRWRAARSWRADQRRLAGAHRERYLAGAYYGHPRRAVPGSLAARGSPGRYRHFRWTARLRDCRDPGAVRCPVDSARGDGGSDGTVHRAQDLVRAGAVAGGSRSICGGRVRSASDATPLLITYRVPWKGTVPQRVRIPPGKLSLQPVAIGADDGGNDIVRSTSV